MALYSYKYIVDDSEIKQTLNKKVNINCVDEVG